MIYLDTSAAITLFVPEPATAAVEEWYESCDDTLVASDWILTEFASALSIKQRRGEIKAEQAQIAWSEFGTFCEAGIRLLPVSRQAFAKAALMTRDAASGLRSGDSLHLAVALEVGATAIATADAALAKNAKERGLGVSVF